METYLYDKLENRGVRCRVCSHFCTIDPGRRGICGVRENQDGTLVSLTYGKVIAQSVDPIEKKPVFHLKPGSLSYSIATVGCNLQCRFCQNADIAQMPRDRNGTIMGRAAAPEEMVDQAVAGGCASMAYTYTEPSVFFELAYDTARLAHDRGLFNIFVTNGFMSPDLVNMAAPFLDAANVDLKAYTDTFYQKYCKARLEPVKQTLRLMKEKGILVEVTTLLIPGLNDDPDELAALAAFIASDLGVDTPWHVSRFHPAYRLTDRGPTPAPALEAACGIGKDAGLRYVYAGNLPGSPFENTCCHNCGALLVERVQYRTTDHMKPGGMCPSCGTPAAGIY